MPSPAPRCGKKIVLAFGAGCTSVPHEKVAAQPSFKSLFNGKDLSNWKGRTNHWSVEDGCIICPWHSSTYALADGHVVHGPSTFPQPCFGTRIRDGQVEVGPLHEASPTQEGLRIAA